MQSRQHWNRIHPGVELQGLKSCPTDNILKVDETVNFGCYVTGRPSIIVLGEPSPSATYVYDIINGTYFAGAVRPYGGNHHAGEVINNMLYVFGGLGGSTATYSAVQARAFKVLK